jgi:hypothetical protein
MDGYPDINDPDFQFLIARRLEFRNLDNGDGLYPHQEFVRRFMSPYTPYKSLIMYHSLGSGKSIACIAVAVDHFLHDGKRCIIVTKGDSGTDNFAKQIHMYHTMSRDADRWKSSLFAMRHYISMSNQIGSMSDDDVVKAFSNMILVLDEVHNVRYLKNATENSVYGSIIRLLKLCHNVKIIIATATPMTDSPEQVHSLLGICNYSRTGYFTEESWSMNGIISYNSTVSDRPASTQMGTTSYVPGMRVYTSDMSGHQRHAYSLENTTQPPDDIYRKLTHISLFCFPDGTHGRDVTDTKMSKARMKTTITSMSTKHTKEIKYVKYNIMPEFAHALVGDELRNSSSKYSEVMRLIEESEGNVFIFLEEVKGSGLLLLASILEQHGYELYLGEDLKNMEPGMRYTMCVGSSEICPNNSDRLDGFNSDLNRNGEYVRILLGSRVIGESITLKNVRQFYCLTPHWNDSTVDQAIGRVVRNGSHTALDEALRNVDIYIHASIFPDDPHNSVDVKKLARCKEKEKSITIVEQMMVECAVDKYIYDPSVPITEVVNFAAAYMHHHEETMLRSLSRLFACVDDGKMVSVHRIAARLKMDITICKEALCRIIYSNHLVDNRFLRAYGDTVFAVNDPSLPYVMVPDAQYVEISPVTFASGQSEAAMVTDVWQFRQMPVKQKAAFVEHCLAQGRRDLLAGMETVYAALPGGICHLLLYRDLESSYTSSNPVPKKPQGKTRVFDGTTWKNVSSIDIEQSLFEQYRSVVREAIQEYDLLYPIYGLISTIDGDMRIRLRDMEDREKSTKDSRYVRRGKSMKSIKKEILISILSEITGETVPNSTSINEAAGRIDEVLVNNGWYIML